MLRAEIERLACVSGTRFGRPVLPLVCRIERDVVDARAMRPVCARSTPRELTVPDASMSIDRTGTRIAGRAPRFVGAFGRQRAGPCALVSSR